MSREHFIYGRRPVRELLKHRASQVRRVIVVDGRHDRSLRELVDSAERAGLLVERWSPRRATALVGDVTHQGIVAETRAFDYIELDDLLTISAKSEHPSLIVVMDQIQDPGNFGAIIRSARAFGAHGAVVPKDRCAGVTAVAVKASAGATSQLPIARVTNLRSAIEVLKQSGVWVFGMSADAPRSLEEHDFTGAVALVIGNEGRGLRRLIAEYCDELVRIPMSRGWDSLNASVSAGIALYEVDRQRRVARGRPSS